MKDKESRRSKGVAFVLYIDRESAVKCVHSLNKTQVSIAAYTHRSALNDFLRKFVIDVWSIGHSNCQVLTELLHRLCWIPKSKFFSSC